MNKFFRLIYPTKTGPVVPTKTGPVVPTTLNGDLDDWFMVTVTTPEAATSAHSRLRLVVADTTAAITATAATIAHQYPLMSVNGVFEILVMIGAPTGSAAIVAIRVVNLLTAIDMIKTLIGTTTLTLSIFGFRVAQDETR